MEFGTVMQISYHDTVKELQGYDWPSHQPFARAEWFGLLEASDPKPLYAVAKLDGEAAICLPLSAETDELHALTNWYAFTWHSLGIIDSTSQKLLTRLAADLRHKAHRVNLAKLTHSDAEICAAAFRNSGWRVFQAKCDVNHILPVNNRTYSEYIASRPGQLRTTLKRKAKKVEVILSTQFDANDWIAYEDIYSDSWKPEEGDPQLLRKFAEMESVAGRFRFALAAHNGEPVAAQFWTVDNGIAYIHKLAHRSSAQKISPGTTLTSALMQRVIDVDRVRLVDFGTGDDAYKRDWMEEVRTRWSLTCVRPESPKNWPYLAKTMVSELVSRKAAG